MKGFGSRPIEAAAVPAIGTISTAVELFETISESSAVAR